MNKKISMFLVVVLVFMTLNINILASNNRVIVNDNEQEINDTYEQANIIDLDAHGSTVGDFNSSNDVDCFIYIPDQNVNVEFVFINKNEDENKINILIEDKTTGEIIDEIINYKSELTDEFYKFKYQHEYLVTITPVIYNSDNWYELAFLDEPDNTQVVLDKQKEIEPNDEMEFANILPRGNNYFGEITEDDIDYYEYELDCSQDMEFKFRPRNNADFFIMVYDINARRYITEGNIKEPGENEQTFFYGYKGHKYRIAITTNGNDTGKYSFFIHKIYN